MALNAFQKLKMSVKSTSPEKSRINTQIDSLSNEINNLISLIGEKLYQNWDNNRPLAEGTLEMLNSVKQKKEEIEALTIELRSIKDKAPTAPIITCPNCNCKYDEAVNFCRMCGTKLS